MWKSDSQHSQVDSHFGLIIIQQMSQIFKVYLNLWKGLYNWDCILIWRVEIKLMISKMVNNQIGSLILNH